MKISFLTVFILLCTQSISAEFKFGLIDPTGYKTYLYSESLNPVLFSTPDAAPSKKYPDKQNFNLFYNPAENITIGIERRNGRFSEQLEMSYKPISVMDIRFLTNYSVSPDQETPLIHHGLFVKRLGIYSFGLNFITNLSLVKKQGHKLMLYNSLKLFNMEFINIVESREHYISPHLNIQTNGKRSRSYLIFKPCNKLIITCISDINLNSNKVTRKNNIRVKFSIPYTTLILKGAVRDKTDRELSYGIEITGILKYIKNEINLSIKYINANLYNFSNTITLRSKKRFKISARYSFEYLENINMDITGRISYKAVNWRFSLIYEQPINDRDRNWKIKSLIYHTSY